MTFSVECRWPRITDCAHLPKLWSEWEGGILYDGGGKITVPFKTLEQEMAEGKQDVPWRNIDDRKAIREKKLFIYTILSAEQPKEFVTALQSQAEEQVSKASKQRGKPLSLYSQAMRILEKDHSQLIVRKAAPYERDVLRWNLSAKYIRQAGL